MKRKAIVYRRQSTLRQVKENTTSIAHQRKQAKYARQWGWPESAIEVIDEEPGGNGCSMENRPGYQRLCQRIAEGDVRLVLVSDLSRLTRSVRVWQQFVNLCWRHSTLIAVDGVIMNGVAPNGDRGHPGVSRRHARRRK